MTQPQPQPQWAVAHQSHMVRDQKHSAIWIIVAWVLAVISIGYMLPWAIAASRGKSNQLAIGLINLLLGWTFIGWIVALVMACGAHQAGSASSFVAAMPMPQQYGPQQQPVQAQPVSGVQVPQQLPPAGWYPSPDGSGQQAWWDGQAWQARPPAIEA